MRNIAIVLVLLGIVSSAVAAPSTQPVAEALAHLRPQHPRLLVLDDQLEAVRSATKTDELAQSMHAQMVHEAEALLKAPPNVYVLNGAEKVLLRTSRSVEQRVMLLGGLYRLDHDRRYAERAIVEMRAAAGFADWYPKHFLDTAEMTAALGIGYDWCFDALSADDRAVIRKAIVEKGIDPGLERMQPNGSLAKLHNNWVQVCYGGLTVGALAIADEEPQRAAEVIGNSIPRIAQIMKLFAPDGGFEEGPAYWDYATTYNTYYLAALDTALGTDFELSKAPGFADTGEYRIQTISPLGMLANFGDCDTMVGYAAQMFWMGRKFDRPVYAEHERELVAHADLHKNPPAMLELLWQFPRAGASPTPLPLAQQFHRIAAGFMRTSWGDPAATYIAFKGGDSRASHGHLDLGTFICEMTGQRWAIDLGAESYGVPSYFGALRPTYYRVRTEAHNTLSIGDSNESTAAKAPLTAFQSSPAGTIAIADLTQCFPTDLKSWRRGLAIHGAKQLVIQDEFEPAHSVHVVWHFHTRATASAAGNTAELTQGGSTVHLKIIQPANATFAIEDASHPPAPNSANAGVHDVQIDLPAVTQWTTITVELTSGEPKPLAVTPLASWTEAMR